MTFPYEAFQLEEVAPLAWQRHLVLANCSVALPYANRAFAEGHPSLQEMASDRYVSGVWSRLKGRSTHCPYALTFLLPQGTSVVPSGPNQWTDAPSYPESVHAWAYPVHVVSVGDYTSLQWMLPTGGIVYPAAQVMCGLSSAQESPAAPYYPPPDCTPPHAGFTTGAAVDILTLRTRAIVCDTPLHMPTPRRVTINGSLARLVPSRPRWRPTPAELEDKFTGAAAVSTPASDHPPSAEGCFEGIALNKTTLKSRTPIHRNCPVNGDIPEAIKVSVQEPAPKQPKRARAPKKARGQTEYGTTKYNCDECLIGFRRPHEQKRHMRETIAHSRPTKRCDACGNKYLRTDALRAHKRSKHGARQI
ncbi:hypothetical protein HETIRDRAFT_321576 [Heterobasidion irregulare TC 32-1]|uniref:C2H2-type domain-containing protein n=1 Tax=Heterobasidion irregulare (strain TC 32-1) TaxID=747525 RepID=W4K2N8_HETIT|nr:uncharacterized protein HETIRDRAFT_321576 [Heterobasidion irregulare TC 32-1]ETW80082.1 hypothetical protein HETIRDRAFT_321576 [Heterobasidion irregulare TC 32-1]